MTEIYGWSGVVLRVDMTKGTIRKERLDPEVASKFIGGRGLNSKVLFDEIDSKIDPLSPSNVLCFAVGPLTSTWIPQTSRMMVSTLSPYTGILGDGNAGGRFSGYIKHAGYDQIIVTGRSESPKYLWIDNDVVELKDASHLWGKNVNEAVMLLEKKNGRDIATACIGKGGENLVRWATAIFDRVSSATRGAGAVMGSKNLKAIAVRGTKPVKVRDKAKMYEIGQADRKWFLKDKWIHDIVGELGSPCVMKDSPHGAHHFDKAIGIGDAPFGAEDIKARLEVSRKACYNCVIHCKDWYEVVSGLHTGVRGGGLEVTVVGLGLQTGIRTPEGFAVWKKLLDENGICVQAGIDALALAYFCYQHGIITKKDTDGLKLDWADQEGKFKLTEMIARREGFGNTLAEGFYNFGKLYPEAMKYVYGQKGMMGVGPVASPDNLSMTFVLGSATSTRGGDNLRTGPSLLHILPSHKRWAEKFVKQGIIPDVFTPIAPIVQLGQRVSVLADSISRCKTGLWDYSIAVPLMGKYGHPYRGTAEALSAATGLQYSSDDLIEAADRITSLERAFNVRQGITRKDDIVPLKPEMKGTAKGDKIIAAHDKNLDNYYTLMGYDVKTGIPTRSTLERLGLKYVADELGGKTYPAWNGPQLWPLEKYPKG